MEKQDKQDKQTIKFAPKQRFKISPNKKTRKLPLKYSL